MADVKISGLPASSVPLAGTEVLPIVQSGQTRQVANNDLRPKQIQSNATTGVLQIAGPTAAATRVMTTPDANFTAARTDAGQTFTGTQNFAALTASQAVFTDASKNLVSNAITGTGNVVMSSSPTLSSPTVDNLTFSAAGASGITYAGWVNNRVVLKQVLVSVPQYFQQVIFDAGSRSVFIDSSSFDGGSSGTVAIRTSSFGSPSARLTVNGAGDVTVNTGNLVMGTAAKGIDFSANTGTAGATKEILDWYEEGTWTPTVTSQTGAITTYVSGGTYTRVGRQVTVTAYADLTTVGTAGGLLVISNFPYKNGAASGAGYLQQSGIVRETGITGVNYACFINGNSTTGYIQSFAGGAITWGNSYQYALSITYYTA